MAVASLLLALPFWGFAGTCVLLFLIGFAGGLSGKSLARNTPLTFNDRPAGIIAVREIIREERSGLHACTRQDQAGNSQQFHIYNDTATARTEGNPRAPLPGNCDLRC